MKLGIPVYEGVNLLDVAGPYEMFSWVDASKRLEVLIVSEDGRPVTTMNGVRIEAPGSFADAPSLDVLWTPGGAVDALERIMADPQSAYLSYLNQVSKNESWVCSVCEGAMLLAQAGLLDGHQATTHWRFVECLRRFPKIDVVEGYPRFVVSGKRLTGGGISSGLDEALKLIELLFDQATAQDVQLTTQYFPAPPVTGTIPAPPRCTMHW